VFGRDGVSDPYVSLSLDLIQCCQYLVLPSFKAFNGVKAAQTHAHTSLGSFSELNILANCLSKLIEKPSKTRRPPGDHSKDTPVSVSISGPPELPAFMLASS
jgi:hypothetical protein